VQAGSGLLFNRIGAVQKAGEARAVASFK
jgi:hypothetical protein